MATLVGDVAAAPNDVLVLGLALSLAENVVALQIALSSSPIVSVDLTIRRIAAARQALPTFLSQALHLDNETILPGGRCHRVAPAAIRVLQSGNLALLNRDGVFVSPFFASLSGQPVDSANLAVVLG